jgi:ABC-type dipeptide transport system, periplasmic component
MASSLKVTVWSVGLFLLSQMWAGCAQNAAERTAFDPKLAGSSDQIVLAIGGESEEGFDPTLGWGRYGSPLFQSTLLRRDENLEIVNDLATGYTVSQDGLTWTVTLRKDAVFSDGNLSQQRTWLTPLTKQLGVVVWST